MARAAGRQGQSDKRRRRPQPSSARCPIAAWRRPRGSRARHKGRSLLVSLEREALSITPRAPSSRRSTLDAGNQPNLPGQRPPNLTAAAFLYCLSLTRTTFHRVVDPKPALPISGPGHGRHLCLGGFVCKCFNFLSTRIRTGFPLRSYHFKS